jgi:hypothetical protein
LERFEQWGLASVSWNGAAILYCLSLLRNVGCSSVLRKDFIDRADRPTIFLMGPEKLEMPISAMTFYYHGPH